MNPKKKKIIKLAGILLFFAVGGIWYVIQGKTLAENRTEAECIQSVFLDGSMKTEESPAISPENDVGQTEKSDLVVYVCGAVNSPGVHILPAGSRLHEAVEMAGGFSAEADLSYHNLARILEDGERIYIVSFAETETLTVKQKAEGEAGVLEDTAGGRINLNTATREQLATLPGIGEVRAESILEYREKVGEFTDIEEIMNISGIGEAMFAKIRDKITVE